MFHSASKHYSFNNVDVVEGYYMAAVKRIVFVAQKKGQSEFNQLALHVL